MESIFFSFGGGEMEVMVPPLPEDITAFTAGERLLMNYDCLRVVYRSGLGAGRTRLMLGALTYVSKETFS